MDLATKKIEVCSFPAPRPNFFAVEGNLLATATNRQIELRYLEKETKFITNFTTEDNVRSIHLHKTKDDLIELVARLGDGRVQIWSPRIELTAKERKAAEEVARKAAEEVRAPQPS